MQSLIGCQEWHVYLHLGWMAMIHHSSALFIIGDSVKPQIIFALSMFALLSYCIHSSILVPICCFSRPLIEEQEEENECEESEDWGLTSMWEFSNNLIKISYKLNKLTVLTYGTGSTYMSFK